MDSKFDVVGMTCSACSSHIEKSLNKLEGINKVNVNLLTNSMTVNYDETKLNDEKVIKAVVDSGYNAFVNTKKSTSKSSSAQAPVDNVQEEIKEMKKRIKTSFLFLVPLMYISMGHMMNFPLPEILHGTQNALTFAFTQFLLTIPIVYVNRKYFQVGFKTLVKGSPNMDSLIAIGSTAAIAYGIFAIYKIGFGLGHNIEHLVMQYSMDLYFESAGTILTLITCGKYLETKSKGKTSEAITKLMNLAPKTAVVLRDGIEEEIDVSDIIVGNIIIIKPGQSIPVDGVITEGNSSVDESALTGESIPVEKQINDKVIAATINKTGFFKFRATKVGDDTTLAQIIQLVEDASSSKAPIAKLADKVSGIFVPVVITIAVLATIIWMIMGYPFEFALSIGISVLVISCPCALGLATPVAIMVGTGKGAENGILIKSAEALETAHTINTVIMDKTGTITEGKPRVTDIITNGVSENMLLKIAASIEKPSEHPLADAIVEEAVKNNIQLYTIDKFNAVAGQGIIAVIDGRNLIAGNIKIMNENSISMGEFEEKGNILAENGKTPLYFAENGNIIGLIAVADVVKATSKQAIEEFKDMGIDVIMLTGDNKRTAEAIRKQLNIPKVISEVMPEDKESVVREIQSSGRKVAMIGDGINDAPALARADVGIAIGAGTDIAIESADIVLMKSDLLDAVTAIHLSKAVIRNIKENLFWAFFYNTIGIPVAAGLFFIIWGWKLNPMIGAAAMSLSSFCVVTNALRLKLFKPHRGNKKSENLNTVKNNISKGEIKMNKTINIEGMSCSHCSGRVEKALNAIEGVNAVVNLEAKTADVTCSNDITEEILSKAVTDAGYEVVGIK